MTTLRFSLSKFSLSKSALTLLAFCLFGAVLKPCHAQAVYVPLPLSDPALTTRLNQLQARTGKPVVVSSYNSVFPAYSNLQNGAASPLFGTTSTTAVLSRIKVICPYGAINPQPVYINCNANNTGEIAIQPATPVTLSFAVEDVSGNIYPGNFAGRRTTIMDNNGPFVGDAVPIVVPVGGFFYERTMLQFAAGSNNYPQNGPGVLTGETATPSTTDPATAAAPVGGGYYFSALAWVGQQVTPGPAVVVQGDSRLASGDYAVSGSTGYMREIFAGTIGLATVDVSGNGYNTLQSPTGQVHSKLYYYATHAYIEHGTNDQGGSTATIVANNLIGRATVEIQKSVGFGAKVILETIAPTLGMASPISGACDVPANQVTPAPDAGRRCYNDWIRGASIATLNTNYAGAGITLAAGTVTASAAGMTSYVEIANLLEANSAGVLTQDGGCWRSPSGPYLTGTATGGTATTVTGTGFGAATLNAMEVKFMSGANAGLYAAVSASSSTSITFGSGQNAAGTAVTIVAPSSGDTFNVYGVYTNDFRHPSSNIVGGVHTIVTSGLLSAATFR